ncbi:MAG: hypothetical protein D6719_12030 [Candidatus Dadabacteria bacterium]|nr:MAG: hypothetical protein D6719_12030 [Candidatus Dadabacteria bacterium]
MRIMLPEQTWLDLEPAGAGSRASAYLIDLIIRWTAVAIIVSAVIYLLSKLEGHNLLGAIVPRIVRSGSFSQVLMAIIIVAVSLIEIAYPVFFEVFYDGVTPGKRLIGIRVLDQRGLPLTLKTSLARNIFIPLEIAPPFLGLIPLVSMMITRNSQRIGDLVAGTIVVREPEPVSISSNKTDLFSGKIVLPLEIYNLYSQYLERHKTLTPDAARRISQTLMQALKDAGANLPDNIEDKDYSGFLKAAFKQVYPIRKSKGSPKQEKLLNNVTTNWPALREQLVSARNKIAALKEERAGLTDKQLLEAADAYQLVCQRYSYLSTFYPNTPEARYAAGLVRYGRRVIYGKRLASAETQSQPFLRRVNSGYINVRPYIATSFAVFVASIIISSLMVRINPGFGWYFISETAAENLESGKLWTENIRGISSIASASIMANNIKVSLLAFALGITGGVGTLLILISNGAMLGGIFTFLTNFRMEQRLLDFVVAHGFLELSIIIVAAGCGLAIGDALLQPGDLTRKESVQQRAKSIMDLIIFSALSLVIAGLIEGFVSPQEIAFEIKLITGILAGAIYWWVLIVGRITPRLIKEKK